MKTSFRVIRHNQDGTSHVMASWRNFPPLVIWFMANMDDKILDEQEHDFDLEKLKVLCYLCRKALSSENWLSKACTLWGLSYEETAANEALVFCINGMMNDILLQGEMIAPATDGARLACRFSHE